MLTFRQYIKESRPPKVIFNDALRNQAYEMRRSGMSDSDISMHFYKNKSSHSTLRNAIDREEHESNPALRYEPPTDHRKKTIPTMGPERKAIKDNALEMHIKHGKSFDEIGKKLGIPRGTVARWVMEAKPTVKIEIKSKETKPTTGYKPISDIMDMIRISRKE